MKRTLVAVAALISINAYADPGGNGTTGASWGGSDGNGVAQLGYFPGWQTASPAKVEALARAEAIMYPVQKVEPAKLEWPAWVKLAG